MNITGSELFVKALKEEGIDILFGYPGGSVIPLFDVLFSEQEIEVVVTRHEQGAVHAADGYARSTGKTGVILVTSGPGATNTITGLATANFDSVPLVCFTGQVPRSMIGNDAFQEADTVGISRPVTKHNYLVTSREELGRVIKSAFILAADGRPGPVLVDLPKDVLMESGPADYPDTVNIRGLKSNGLGDEDKQIAKAASALQQARRPLFYIGGGLHISGASPVFRKLVEATGVPVVTSLMGIGAFPADHPRYLGMLGMHGTYAANMAVTYSDLLFAVGNRFDDRATGVLQRFAPEARIVHIDIDPISISRNVPVEIPIVGDARQVLEKLLPLAKAPEIKDWLSRIDGWQQEHPLEMVSEFPDSGHLAPDRVIRAISDAFPDAIIATEVGQNQMWTALFYKFRHPRSLLTSGGLGTMGYGFPAALGAQLGNPGRRVIDIAGDGSIQMNIQELATAVYKELPVIVAILNNGYLGMVRQWQELFCDERYSATCLGKGKGCPGDCSNPGENCPPYVPDFVKLAEAYGAVGLRVCRQEEIAPALQEAAASKKRPVLIDFIIEPEANVYPMVPPGAGIDQMIFAQGGRA
jgi:acetolactate synthase-1/2/3 large subunit